jgi:hypothetical protein
MVDQERCTKQFALIVVKNVKFLSTQTLVDQFIVVNVSQNTGDFGL